MDQNLRHLRVRRNPTALILKREKFQIKLKIRIFRMNSMTTVLKDNFESLRWDAEQKNTARDYFGLQWQNTITASISPRKSQLETDIRTKKMLLAELQALQSFVASIKDQGASLRDLTTKYPALASMFSNVDDQMTYLLSQPPMTFLVSS